MSDRDGAGGEGHAKAAWRTGRPSRWRVKSDAMLRQREGVAEPGEAEPDVVAELLHERAWLDALAEDQDGD